MRLPFTLLWLSTTFLLIGGAIALMLQSINNFYAFQGMF
jgi:hypothetical protein